jgi:hypothetical protein
MGVPQKATNPAGRNEREKAKEALIYSTENKSVLLYYSFSQFSAGKREKQ